MSHSSTAASVGTRRALRVKPKRRRSVGARIAGVFGELLITAGVLVGLFVAWQWFWTDIVAIREWHVLMNDLPWELPPPVVAEPELERSEDPPIGPRPEPAEIFGQIYIPRFGTDFVAPIAGGTDRRTVLDALGVGLFDEGVMPGEIGNFATAGHRNTFGRPYNLMAELVVGDPIVIRTETTWYVYRVVLPRDVVMPDSQWFQPNLEVPHYVVMPYNVEVVSPIPGLMPGEIIPELTRRIMTLTSCHPIGSARERIIVHAEFDFWMPVSDGVPELLVEAGVTIVGLEDTPIGREVRRD